ncbi:MAG: hypothetical protein M1819_005714 [Sarea resinae]|nr:MAG: hypothetical protein M1819_005714 [Sarea resinae]
MEDVLFGPNGATFKCSGPEAYPRLSDHGPLFEIRPPVLNSACPWATTLEDLRALYDCPYTGAVTTRTTTLNGFPHDPNVHQHTFFKISRGAAEMGQLTDASDSSSLNTLGYSPFNLQEYMDMIQDIVEVVDEKTPNKLFIVSVTGTPKEVAKCYTDLVKFRENNGIVVAMEINLSCPNIPDKPPPAYKGDYLFEYLYEVACAMVAETTINYAPIAVGLKLPPFTYQGQFYEIVGALKKLKYFHSGLKDVCPINFITTTNTLGSSLVLSVYSDAPAIASASGSGIGGLAGAALHPLALGNVKTLRGLLDQHEVLKDIVIIGVGGVCDGDGYRRMRSVGANAVAVATALGVQGLEVFAKIHKEEGPQW